METHLRETKRKAVGVKPNCFRTTYNSYVILFARAKGLLLSPFCSAEDAPQGASFVFLLFVHSFDNASVCVSEHTKHRRYSEATPV
jgi:hypothetical protein